MTMSGDLQTAIEEELSGANASHLADRYQTLSRAYRNPDDRDRIPPASRDQVQAYLAARLPATYQAVEAVLAQVALRLRSDWHPRSLLDLGAGPGTVMWSLLRRFTSITEVTLLEYNPHMTRVGRRLARHAADPRLTAAHWIQADLERSLPTLTAHDGVVVAAYAVGELTATGRRALFEWAVRIRPPLLILIEPGTPKGFATILAARQHLMAHGATILAPCPADGPCPLARTSDWCHFSVRVARSRWHRQLKAARRGYEDEKFSFVALTFPGETVAWGERSPRILRHPHIGKGYLRFTLCTENRLVTRVVTRSEPGYHRFRKLKWGDALAEAGPEPDA